MQIRKLLLILIAAQSLVSPIVADEIGEQTVSLMMDVYPAIQKDLLSLVDMDRLDTHGEPKLNILWSQDETKIVIVASINAYSKKGKPDFGGVGGLYFMDILNKSNPERIKWCESTNSISDDLKCGIIGVQWSQSGNYFSFIESRGGRSRELDNNASFLWIIEADSLNVISKKRISPVLIGKRMRGYSWSAADDKIAYIGFDGTIKDVFIVDVRNNISYETEINKYVLHFEKTDLTWSPDGKKIAFTKRTYGKGNESLFVLDINSKKITNLFSANDITVYNGYAFWSPDSKNLLVSEVEPDEKFNIYLLEVDSGKSRSLITLNNSASTIRGWSSDSKRILFTVCRTKKNVEIYTLYSMPIDRLTPTPLFESETNPSVTPYENLTILTFRGESYEREKLVLLKDGRSLLIDDVLNYVFNYDDELLYIHKVNNENSTIFVVDPFVSEKSIILPMKIDVIGWSPSGRYLIAKNISESDTRETENSDYGTEAPGFTLMQIGILLAIFLIRKRYEKKL